jgi:signal transduction histidine kinase
VAEPSFSGSLHHNVWHQTTVEVSSWLSECELHTRGLRQRQEHRTQHRCPHPPAHDINNPLDALLNLLYLLETEPNLTEQGRHYLSLAQEEVRRISLIAHETLDQHKVVVMPETTSVVKLLASVLDFYQQRFDSSGITVQTRYTCDRNIPVYAEQLRRVFSNLLLNALEAMPEGGRIQARVAAGQEWSGHKRHGVSVTIADNGPGMPSNKLRQMFEPLFTTKPAGHGMGLSLVKGVVQKHNGWLRVRSSTQPGRQGTVFSVFLPAA